MDKQRPYFHARLFGKDISTDGLESCVLGHKINNPSHEKPDGVFVEWSWDGKRLSVFNDRNATYPLYYFLKQGEIAVSTSIPKLIELGAPVTLDDAGMAVFLRRGYFIGEDTPFKCIRAVPPCVRFEWENGNLRLDPERISVKANRISRTKAIDAYISLFRQSIKRRISQETDFILPISGGRDSRHILLELCASGHRPKSCMTVQGHPTSSDEDLIISRQLTKALNLNHILVFQPRSRFNTELRKNVMTNFSAIEHAWYLAIGDYLRGKINITYNGIGGDTLSSGWYSDVDRKKRKYLEYYRSGHFDDLAESLLSNEREQFVAKMLPGKQYRRFNRELATSHLIEELTRHADMPNPASSFEFFNRTRRSIALTPYLLLSEIKTVYSPYLDYDLCEFLLSLPDSIFLEGDFHTETILRAYPSYSHIPFAKKSKRPYYNWLHSIRFSLELMQYAGQNYTSEFVRNSFVLPRLARCIIDKGFNNDMKYFNSFVIYLLQLGRFCETNKRVSSNESIS